MKNLKKLTRDELKKVSGGNAPPDMCNFGDGFCEQYGLECGLFVSQSGWQALRCI